MTETFGPYAWGLPDGAPSTMATHIAVDEVEPGYEVRMIDDDGALVGDGRQGEILVRGPTLMLGLHKQARHDVFDADGFYRTGDLGVRRGGRIHFEGRRGNVIRRSGANVAPHEVETLLVEAEGVEQAFVVGIPDERRGQLIAAAVVAQSGVHLDPAALRTWTRQRLSAFKVPDVIAIMSREEIPRTDAQKVALAALADELSARHRASSRMT
jgi:acyl-CoA synthetase (AMP-forming)/AMP-acid ligase II